MHPLNFRAQLSKDVAGTLGCGFEIILAEFSSPPANTRGKLQTLDSGTANLKTQPDAALNCAWREAET